MHKPDRLTLQQTLKRDLDLEPILVKAMDTEEGYGWTFAFASRVAKEYRRFLVLCIERQQDTNHPILSSGPVADFWRLHILDTEKYIEDCQHCFGAILHRFSHFGRRTDQDGGNLREAWLKMIVLYESAFGKHPPSDIWPYSTPGPTSGPPSPASAYLDHGAEDANSSHETLSQPARNKVEARQWIMKDLDLEPIVVKAVEEEKGNGWSFDFAGRVAEE